MDIGSSKILESVVQRTLHGHNFSRSSSQAAQVLTDLLARYLSLLTLTCAQYAQHAGRSALSIYDILSSLEELGTTSEELVGHYESDGKELARYAYATSRRSEELVEMRGYLQDGLRDDSFEDAIRLVYARMPSLSPLTSEDEDAEEIDEDLSDLTYGFKDEELDNSNGVIESRVNGDTGVRPYSTPPLPLSPISNPSTPPRKRPRLAEWHPPSHIPDFLPPYPSTSLPPSPKASMDVDLPSTPLTIQPERHLSPAHQLSTSISTSDYLTPVPYSMSCISSVPERHLPRPPSPVTLSSSQSTSSIPGLEINRTLVHAYHHVLTNPPPSIPPANPSRHRIAMAMLGQMYSNPRWSPSDTLFSSIHPQPPRVVAPSPAWPKPLVEVPVLDDPAAAEKNKKLSMPPPISKPVVFGEAITPISNQATSRILDLSRHLLPPGVFNRATKLQPPPVFVRSNEKLFYGPGVPAPWNDINRKPQPTLTNAISKKVKDAFANGKGSETKAAAANDKGEVVDATLYATWEWDRKDYRISLPPGKRARQSFSLQAGSVTRASSGISIVTGSAGGHLGKIRGSGKMDANKG